MTKDDEYMSQSEFVEFMCMDNATTPILFVCKKLDINYTYKGQTRNYNTRDAINAKNLAIKYYEDYYTKEEALQLITEGMFRKIKGIKVLKEYTLFYKRLRFLYSKEVVLSASKSNRRVTDYNLLDEEMMKKYYSKEEVVELLEIETQIETTMKVIKDNFGVRNFKKGVRIYYDKKDIEKVIEIADCFFYNSYSNTKAKSMLPDAQLERLNCFKIDDRFSNLYRKTHNPDRCKVFYNKNEVDNLVKLVQSANEGGYVTQEEAMDILDVSRSLMKRYRNELEIKEISINNRIYLCRDDLIRILKKRKEFYEIYIDVLAGSKKYSNGKIPTLLLKDLKKYEAPLFAISKNTHSSIAHMGGVLKQSEVIKHIEDWELRKNNKIDSTIHYDCPYETYKLRLNSLSGWDGFEGKSKYTEMKWFEYVESTLRTTTMKGRLITVLINKLVNCTLDLNKSLIDYKKAEIYMFTSSEINFFLKTIGVYVRAMQLFYFLREVSMDLFVSRQIGEQAGFKITDIKNPSEIYNINTKKYNENDEIYSFEVFSSVIKYCCRIDKHVIESIKEIESIGTAKYASTWLYVMLHLNNAWRSGDVNNFPKLDIDDLLDNYNILDYSWFFKNSIELPLAMAVIQRVRQWEFIISKTQLKGTFFCSEELAPSLVSAIIILTLYAKRQQVSIEKIMKFDTKYNTSSIQQIAEFVKNIEMEGFKFKSRKFNKTVMTFIYYISNISGDAKSLTYVMLLRGHANMESTVRYLCSNPEQIGKLSKQLFARGEFGFVQTLLIQKIKGEKLSFEDVTKEVVELNESFGDLVKINTTIGFLNTMRAERAEVFTLINDMSFDECCESIMNIYTRKMSSKDDVDIQCLKCKKGCDKAIYEGNCPQCQFSIPTIYALSQIGESILRDMTKMIETKVVPNRLKLAVAIERKKVVLMEAIKKFGKEYVYSCMGTTSEKFTKLLSYTPRVDDVVNEINMMN